MTNPRELVERLRLHGQDSVGRFYECDQAAQALSAALDREERLEADNTRLRGLPPDWQPIETAPRDGTVIDVWRVLESTVHGKHGHRVANARFVPHLQRWENDTGYVIQKMEPPGDDGLWSASYLTHWMPLPEPPQ